MTHGLKSIGVRALQKMGVSRLVGDTAWRRRRLLILCYHGISLGDEHLWNRQMFMAPARFERHLDLLVHAGCTVLGLDEALERLRLARLPKRSVCLTFDDGYFNFAQEVQPRLRRYGFPATVYLATRRCEHNFPGVPLGLSYVLWKSGRDQLDGSGLPGLGDGCYRIAKPDERRAVINSILTTPYWQRAGAEEHDALLRDVATRVGVDYDGLVESRILSLMRPAEVTALATEGVDFQLHTHHHRTPVEPDLFVREIRENRWRLEKMTGMRPTHFCYPSGIYRHSYFPLLAAEGVVSATTTEPGIAARDTVPFLLPRFIVTNAVSDAAFEAWLNGLVPLLHRVLQRPGRARPQAAPVAS